MGLLRPLQAGADARLKDNDQQSALVHAANSGSVQSVQLLLEQARSIVSTFVSTLSSNCSKYCSEYWSQ